MSGVIAVKSANFFKKVSGVFAVKRTVLYSPKRTVLLYLNILSTKKNLKKPGEDLFIVNQLN